MGFLPVTREEMRRRGWDRADVILVSGDAYIDSPYSGVAVIAQVQIFTPTPLTAATYMYYTGLDPESGRAVTVERGVRGRQRQKVILTCR